MKIYKSKDVIFKPDRFDMNWKEYLYNFLVEMFSMFILAIPLSFMLWIMFGILFGLFSSMFPSLAYEAFKLGICQIK